MYRVNVAVVALSCQALPSAAESSTEAGACEFDNAPVGVGYFWDPTCSTAGGLGCDADGKNIECRLCGAGEFLSVDCPTSSCHFPNDPFVAYYWDKDCVAGMLGCWADGVHAQCRFCGDFPFTSIQCPEGAAAPNSAGCAFDIEPETEHYWEPGCGGSVSFGCNADGKSVNCRFCGAGNYSDIPCPAAEACHFANDPTAPYFWDPSCHPAGGLGCNADGIHKECRFCAVRPFEDVPCPAHLAPPADTCHWPVHGEPSTPYFWDPTCQEGQLGCWADGYHVECRFCGEGDFATISCPSASATTRRLEEEVDAAAPLFGGVLVAILSGLSLLLQ